MIITLFFLKLQMTESLADMVLELGHSITKRFPFIYYIRIA